MRVDMVTFALQRSGPSVRHAAIGIGLKGTQKKQLALVARTEPDKLVLAVEKAQVTKSR